MNKKLLSISILGSLLVYTEIIFQSIQIVLKDTYVTGGYLITIVIVVAFIVNWLSYNENKWRPCKKTKVIIAFILYDTLIIISLMYLVSLLTGNWSLVASKISTIYVISELVILVPIFYLQTNLIVNKKRIF